MAGGGAWDRASAKRAVAARLRALRLGQNLTQRQLAERAGLSLEGVWTVENARTYPRRSTQELLARALRVSTGELMGAA